METMYKGIPFSPQVALADGIGAGDTTIPVTDISAFPDAPNLATIGTDEDGETILYTAKTTDARRRGYGESLAFRYHDRPQLHQQGL